MQQKLQRHIKKDCYKAVLSIHAYVVEILFAVVVEANASLST